MLLGGHLDSWDVGTGASDDGVGCVVTWEALRLMKKLGIRPRRTVRLVLWANEENGLRGAAAYAEKYARRGRIMSSRSSRTRRVRAGALGFSGSVAARQMMPQIGTLLAPLGLPEIGAGGGGADIGPIAQAGNVPTMAYLGDPARLLPIHHTAADTVERIAPEELSKAAAAIAVDHLRCRRNAGSSRGNVFSRERRIVEERHERAASERVRMLANFGERDVEDARLAWRVLPLHEDRALIRAFDDARLSRRRCDTSRLTDRRMRKKREAGTASVRAITFSTIDPRRPRCRGPVEHPHQVVLRVAERLGRHGARVGQRVPVTSRRRSAAGCRSTSARS